MRKRIDRLERAAPREIDWGFIYDARVEMEAVTAPPPGANSEERAREQARSELGSKESFIERQQREVARWQ